MVLILSENVFISVNWLFLADVPINSNSSSTTRSARTKRQGTKSVSYVHVRVRLFIADAYLLQPRSRGQVLPLRVPLGFSLELVLNVSQYILFLADVPINKVDYASVRMRKRGSVCLCV